MMTEAETIEEEPLFPDPEDTFNNLTDEERMIASGDVIPCDVCDGSGEVRQYGPYADSDIASCTRCRATGWIHAHDDEEW